LFAKNEAHELFLLKPRAQKVSKVSSKNEQLAQTPWRGTPRGAGPNAAASVASA